MSLPDFHKMIADVPGALHCAVVDIDGVAHDAVMTRVSNERGGDDYGFATFGSDEIYIPLPFDAPSGKIVIISGETREQRKIEAVTRNAIGGFVEITVGGCV